MTTQTHDDTAIVLYAEARDAWATFAEAMECLGREMRYIDDFTYRRVDAYPGWDGSRDVGAGQSMDGWLDEIGQALGVKDEPMDDER